MSANRPATTCTPFSLDGKTDAHIESTNCASFQKHEHLGERRTALALDDNEFTIVNEASVLQKRSQALQLPEEAVTIDVNKENNGPVIEHQPPVDTSNYYSFLDDFIPSYFRHVQSDGFSFGQPLFPLPVLSSLRSTSPILQTLRKRSARQRESMELEQTFLNSLPQTDHAPVDVPSQIGIPTTSMASGSSENFQPERRIQKRSSKCCSVSPVKNPPVAALSDTKCVKVVNRHRTHQYYPHTEPLTWFSLRSSNMRVDFHSMLLEVPPMYRHMFLLHFKNKRRSYMESDMVDELTNIVLPRPLSMSILNDDAEVLRIKAKAGVVGRYVAREYFDARLKASMHKPFENPSKKMKYTLPAIDLAPCDLKKDVQVVFEKKSRKNTSTAEVLKKLQVMSINTQEVVNEIFTQPLHFELPTERVVYSKNKPMENVKTVPVGPIHRPVYDIDEMDLNWIRETSYEDAKCIITIHEFQDIMNILEVQSYINRSKFILKELQQPRQPFDDLEKIICNVCNIIEDIAEHAMLQCMKCNVSVHSNCYGIPDENTDVWVCDACKFNQKFASCLLCPLPHGAVHKIENHSLSFVHVTCALWHPGMRNQIAYYRNRVGPYTHMRTPSTNVVCNICGIRWGSVIFCCAENCSSAYHVECAYRFGLSMRQETLPKNHVKYTSLCQVHSECQTDGTRKTFDQSDKPSVVPQPSLTNDLNTTSVKTLPSQMSTEKTSTLLQLNKNSLPEQFNDNVLESDSSVTRSLHGSAGIHKRMLSFVSLEPWFLTFSLLPNDKVFESFNPKVVAEIYDYWKLKRLDHGRPLFDIKKVSHFEHPRFTEGNEEIDTLPVAPVLASVSTFLKKLEHLNQLSCESEVEGFSNMSFVYEQLSDITKKWTAGTITDNDFLDVLKSASVNLIGNDLFDDLKAFDASHLNSPQRESSLSSEVVDADDNTSRDNSDNTTGEKDNGADEGCDNSNSGSNEDPNGNANPDRGSGDDRGDGDDRGRDDDDDRKRNNDGKNDDNNDDEESEGSDDDEENDSDDSFLTPAEIEQLNIMLGFDVGSSTNRAVNEENTGNVSDDSVVILYDNIDDSRINRGPPVAANRINDDNQSVIVLSDDENEDGDNKIEDGDDEIEDGEDEFEDDDDEIEDGEDENEDDDDENEDSDSDVIFVAEIPAPSNNSNNPLHCATSQNTPVNGYVPSSLPYNYPENEYYYGISGSNAGSSLGNPYLSLNVNGQHVNNGALYSVPIPNFEYVFGNHDEYNQLVQNHDLHQGYGAAVPGQEFVQPIEFVQEQEFVEEHEPFQQQEFVEGQELVNEHELDQDQGLVNDFVDETAASVEHSIDAEQVNDDREGVNQEVEDSDSNNSEFSIPRKRRRIDPMSYEDIIALNRQEFHDNSDDDDDIELL